MGNIARAAGTGLTALGFLFGTAGVAQADDQSFLNYIHDNGVPMNAPMGVGDASHLMAGDMICRMLRTGHTPADLPFLGLVQEQYKPQLVEGAQHELCPDTLKQAAAAE
ncbi:DUF732 domain-containing protein [Mycobacterium sp. SMC-11]|uniref:DUF732 domain-containing protein n=1 Tax=Mycobacterium sp. SMC-11 TaxID=3385969 RepID=UPI00390CD33D